MVNTIITIIIIIAGIMLMILSIMTIVQEYNETHHLPDELYKGVLCGIAIGLIGIVLYNMLH